MYTLMTITKNIPDKAHSDLFFTLQRFNKKLPPNGFFLLAVILLLLSGLAATDFSPKERLLVKGEIAPTDFTADRTFLLEDKKATNAKRELAEKMQPLVLDLIPNPIEDVRNKLQSLLIAVNQAEAAEEKEALRLQISQDLGEEVSLTTVSALASPDVQKAITATLLPLVEQQMREGILPEMRLTMPYQGGVLIRNLASGEEVLHADTHSVPDLKSTEVDLSQQIKKLSLSAQNKRAITQIFGSLLRPTLVPNYEATQSRAVAAVQAVTPVVHRIQRGEVLVQQGERVNEEQQLKMQVLLQKKSDRFNGKLFMGLFFCGLLLSGGLLFTPSGKPVHPMTNKDFVFLSALVAIFSLMTKGFAILGIKLAASSVTFMPESLAYAVPIAGAAALSSMIFSARRYMVTGLLLAFFCTAMINGGLGLFLFYFLTAMWSTWLTGRTTSRQDMVWSIIPLTIGLFAMWSAATCLQGGAHTRYFSEVMAVIAGSFFSMLLTFALAPVVEMAFGYTTRFRLMELLNLEQPLLRDLMLNAPGTYHHSLIVSNMVEAGAKRVGAHSLLCKVAALYHDIGKITKANYFIENQLTEDNPHNRLQPSMSALILISHAKQGTDLAQQHRLGKEVTDIIRQHHGTSVIQYFYQRALNQTDAAPPRIEDYRYPGPKPQTREAALVMLADIVEASSRTLTDPTPTRLRQHIDTIIKSIYSAGQLDEAELTFRDLDNLADSFHQVLRGIFHHRVTYPDKLGKDKGIKPAIVKAPVPSPVMDAPFNSCSGSLAGVSIHTTAKPSAGPGIHLESPAHPGEATEGKSFATPDQDKAALHSTEPSSLPQ